MVEFSFRRCLLSVAVGALLASVLGSVPAHAAGIGVGSAFPAPTSCPARPGAVVFLIHYPGGRWECRYQYSYQPPAPVAPRVPAKVKG